MNRIVTLALLALMIMTLGATALAQDALPLPALEDGTGTRANAIELVSPTMFGAIEYGMPMAWQNVGTTSYKVKFTMVMSGQKLTWKPSVLCLTNCVTLEQPMQLFQAAEDGDIVDVKVIAKVAGVKYKSATRRVSINEVETPTPLKPYNYQELGRSDVSGFEWHHPRLGTKYTLIVRDYDNDSVVLKRKIDPAGFCFDAEPYDKCKWSFGGDTTVQSVLQTNHHYYWFLKVVGPTGEKDKSATYHLITLADKN